MKGLHFDSKYMVGTTSLREFALPIVVAPNEIVKLHKVYYSVQTSAGNSIRLIVDLKSIKGEDAAPAETEAQLVANKSTVWRSNYITAVGATVLSHHDTISFDPPVVLVRTPRAIIHGGGAAVYYYVWVYYEKETASKEEMTRLMLKRHH